MRSFSALTGLTLSAIAVTGAAAQHPRCEAAPLSAVEFAPTWPIPRCSFGVN